MKKKWNNPGQFDLFEAKKERDEGIDVASANNPKWVEDAVGSIIKVGKEKYPDGFTADDIRFLSPPPNQYCAGAAFMIASRSKRIENTGKTRPSKFKTNHARRLTVWIYTP